MTHFGVRPEGAQSMVNPRRNSHVDHRPPVDSGSGAGTHFSYIPPPRHPATSYGWRVRRTTARPNSIREGGRVQGWTLHLWLTGRQDPASPYTAGQSCQLGSGSADQGDWPTPPTFAGATTGTKAPGEAVVRHSSTQGWQNRVAGADAVRRNPSRPARPRSQCQGLPPRMGGPLAPQAA